MFVQGESSTHQRSSNLLHVFERFGYKEVVCRPFETMGCGLWNDFTELLIGEARPEK